MDIPDYLIDPNPDRQEWILRKIMSLRWELRRAIEEMEYLAEQYQMKKKYKRDSKQLEELNEELENSIIQSIDLATQIRNFAQKDIF